MGTATLIQNIRQHEKMCSMPDDSQWEPGFVVKEVCEIADGVVAVCDTDNDFLIYFDRDKYQVKHPRLDISSDIDNFPGKTGLCSDIPARDWQDVGHYAETVLTKLAGEGVRLHPSPIPVAY